MAGQGQGSPRCIKEVRQICGKMCIKWRACVNSHDGCQNFQMVLWGTRGNMVVWRNGAVWASYSFNAVTEQQGGSNVANLWRRWRCCDDVLKKGTFALWNVKIFTIFRWLLATTKWNKCWSHSLYLWVHTRMVVLLQEMENPSCVEFLGRGLQKCDRSSWNNFLPFSNPSWCFPAQLVNTEKL